MESYHKWKKRLVTKFVFWKGYMFVEVFDAFSGIKKVRKFCNLTS